LFLIGYRVPRPDEKTYDFVSINRRHFKLREDARGHRLFVDFEGARNNERPDIPPSGDEIDYLTFGGI